MSLAGKTVVVTGAASGIGAETVRTLRRAGASVVGMDRNRAAGVDRFVAVDLSEPASIAQAVSALPGDVDALCNIAGLPPTAGRLAVLKVNVLGLRALTEAVVPLLNDAAAIVNVASLAGVGWPAAADAVRIFLAQADFDNVEALCDALEIDDERSCFFSKEALVAWTMQNRWRWRDRGICMNCIAPGPVDAPIPPDCIATLGERAEEGMRVMERPGRPEDIAPVIAFLCGDGGAWSRGANMPRDGGMRAHVLCAINGLDMAGG